jgi:hypothetical protein
MRPKYLIIHLLKYLKNSSDLESKAKFQYLAQNSQDKLPIHDFIAQGGVISGNFDFGG